MKKVIALFFSFCMVTTVTNTMDSLNTVPAFDFDRKAALLVFIVGASILPLQFFHQAVKEFSRNPQLQDYDPTYSDKCFLEGAAYSAMGKVMGLHDL